ncbi:unnamed protein product [Sphenostylis stenocarpa]|uniref:Uncharacterized protein n=1 Tax=Sphenostylis stenocarpa TaxID=92480 RepID=A0AA86VTH6_9FABA|nr:unnamed protein product [Sphenostylis stenocarpa]
MAAIESKIDSKLCFKSEVEEIKAIFEENKRGIHGNKQNQALKVQQCQGARYRIKE